jgi:uncharacterized protein
LQACGDVHVIIINCAACSRHTDCLFKSVAYQLNDLCMLGNLSPSEIESVLQSQLVGRIACSANGETYVVPISYAYDGDFIYCHTTEGKKIEMMRLNPSVCFEVDRMEDMANWQSVIIYGTFAELHEPKEKREGIDKLLNRYLPMRSSVTTHLGAHWPFHPSEPEEIHGIIFRVSIKEKTGRFESTTAQPAIAG